MSLWRTPVIAALQAPVQRSLGGFMFKKTIYRSRVSVKKRV
jgi:hypothetical protein